MIMRQHTTSSTAILLFIKNPVRGQVKTRLAAVLGDYTAIELYQNFVLDILDMTEQTGHPCTIFYSPPDAGDAVADWLGDLRDYLPQEGHDLGERMANAFRVLFSRGLSRAVLIGSDLPDLPQGIIEEAFDALRSNDAVIGPASDGGYYLIGFRNETFFPDVFREIPWGTNTVQEQTRKIFDRAGYQVYSLPQWKDVDTVDDLRSFAERNAGTEFASARTMTYIDNFKGGLWNPKFSSS
jgi:rSAM/selenodomain-associated transferase 1